MSTQEQRVSYIETFLKSKYSDFATSPAPAPAPTPAPAPAPAPTPAPIPTDAFGTRLINTPVTNGPRFIATSWNNGISRTVLAVNPDPHDSILMVRGNGKAVFDGKGQVTLSGDEPRMYLTKQDNSFAPFKNTEITFYGMRVKDNNISWAGLVAAVRSKHHLSGDVNNVYARIRNNGYVDFAYEQVHPNATVIKSADNPLISGGLPFSKWIGYKFVMKNLSTTKILYELFMDLSDGLNGGDWKSVLRMEDTDSNRISRLINQVGCCYIRNTQPTDFRYKKLTVYEIVP